MLPCLFFAGHPLSTDVTFKQRDPRSPVRGAAAVAGCLQVAEQGTNAELLELKGIYWGLVRRQQKGLGPADRDLSPRIKDPPMLSSRDWDYGGESSTMPSR